MVTRECVGEGCGSRSASTAGLVRVLAVLIASSALIACSPFEDIKNRLNPPEATPQSPAPGESPDGGEATGSHPAPDDGSSTEQPSDPPADTPEEPVEEPAAGPSPLTFSSQELPIAFQGKGYDAPVAVTGGVAPIKFTLIEGTLPSGLRFDDETGRVVGTTTDLGAYSFRIAVIDSSAEAVELEADVSLNVTTPATDFVAVSSGGVEAAAAGLGFASGLVVTMARGGDTQNATRLDWEKIDYGIDFCTRIAQGGLAAGDLDLQQMAGSYLRVISGGQKFALDYVGCDFDGWIWIEKEGTVRFRLTAIDDLGRLSFDGAEIAAADQGETASAEVANVKRGFHRIRYVHFNRLWGLNFRVEMQEPGDEAPTTIPAGRLYHGPATLELPLIERTAIQDALFGYQLKTSGVDASAKFSIAGGALHAGLSLSESGKISGTPTESGTRYFTLRIDNGAGASTLRRLALHVLGAVGSGTRNDEDVMMLDFDNGTRGGSGIQYGADPYAKWGSAWFGLTGSNYTISGYWNMPANMTAVDAIHHEPDRGVLDRNGALFLSAQECGFHFSTDQQRRIGDEFPAARKANRVGLFIHFPDRARNIQGVETDQTADASHFKIHTLAPLHIAGFNATRFQNAAKEMDNYHFYHVNSEYWPAHWRVAKLREIGGGWWYYETGEQSSVQRSGPGRRLGLYNPIEEIGRGYIETLSFLYLSLEGGPRGMVQNTYPDGAEFRFDKLRMYRADTTVAMRSQEGLDTVRAAVGSNATVVDLPFKVTSTATKSHRFKISRLNGNIPLFNGDNVWIDSNANGTIDEGDIELRDQFLTPSFAPGETRYFVYRVNVAGASDNTTVCQGINLRVLDPTNVLTLDGDSIQFLVYKSSSPASVKLPNIYGTTNAGSTPSPTGAVNVAPQVAITQWPNTVKVGEVVEVTGTATDADGPYGLRPYWDFGDATKLEFGTTTSHTYTRPGTYRVRFHACDKLARSQAEITITVTE